MTTKELEDQAVTLSEAKRTYHFPDGQGIEFENIIELIVHDSGTHRLKTNDGRLHIVAPGWLAITIDDHF